MLGLRVGSASAFYRQTPYDVIIFKIQGVHVHVHPQPPPAGAHESNFE